MKHSNKLIKKREKGQVLIVLALTALGLIAILGLAIDTGYLYVSYARLRRAVDAAGLAATGEFKRPPSGLTPAQQQAILLSNIAGAAKQLLKLNDIVFDTDASFADPVTGQIGLSVETCDNAPGDSALCKDPPQKLVRIKVQERVPIFFLAVIPGFPRYIPIMVESVSQAASLDVVLLIDSSESMAWYNSNDVKLPQGSAMIDPKTCNESDPGASDGYKGDCFPFQKVKAAATSFIDQLYFPYDRVSIVTFDQIATVDLELSEDPLQIEDAIQELEVFEGMGLCAYNSDDPAINFSDPASQSPVPPLPYTDPDEIWASCRLLSSTNAFVAMTCPLFYGPSPSLELCGNTNPGAGFVAAANTLAGVYPPTPPIGFPGTRCVDDENCPVSRDDAVWVVIFLSDGAPNSAFATDGTPICPGYTQTYDWLGPSNRGAPCRDNNSDASNRDSTSNLYDAEDYARDMADVLIGNNAFVFSIAMPGSEAKNSTWTGQYPPAQALLRYVSEGQENGGDYYPAATASDLNKIFLSIANKIATRINQ